MKNIITSLEADALRLRHYERQNLLRGNNKQADRYAKSAKEYEEAIKILKEHEENN